MPELTDEEREQYVRTPLEAARRDAKQLAPVVGAGLSVPLGAPTWKDLVARLRAASSLEPQQDERPGELFGRVRERLGSSTYETLIQQWLSVPDHQTSLTHQAIVAANVRFILTSNLDYALERAFELSGRPLRPENVIIGSQPNSERLLKGVTRKGTVLVKVHGTLQDPESWVLDQKAYDDSYVAEQSLTKLWRALELRPLFIGFGFADDDVNESLRAVEVTYRRGGYAIMSISAIRQHSATLRRNGIMPIAVLDFQQIPEVVDEIFQCSSIGVERRIEIGTNTRTIVVGATRVDTPTEFDDATEFDVATAIANAVEVQPYSSFLTGEPRRSYGQRGQYFNSLLRWIDSNKLSKVNIVIGALTCYPDVFLSQLLPRALRQQKPAEILKAMWKASDGQLHEQLQQVIKQRVLDILNGSVNVGYVSMRSLAWFASVKMHSHPAMEMPPAVTQFDGSLNATKYSLTRYQVGTLRQDKSLCESYRIRPYTLTSRDEIYEILALLNDQFGQEGRWRLPTGGEWKQLVLMTAGRWPWGDADPERGRHAHLRYVSGGAIATHPLEVGVFPGDQSPFKDLVGNVYEVVSGEPTRNDLSLAGGSWTTSFKDSATSRFPLISSWTGRFRDNVGLRLVLERHPTP